MNPSTPTHDPTSLATHPSGETILLSQLGKGEGRVVRVEGDASDVARLMAMGICFGRRVEVIKQGDPLIVRVVGARVGLSARLAAHVVVTLAERTADSVNAA